MFGVFEIFTRLHSSQAASMHNPSAGTQEDGVPPTLHSCVLSRAQMLGSVIVALICISFIISGNILIYTHSRGKGHNCKALNKKSFLREKKVQKW